MNVGKKQGKIHVNYAMAIHLVTEQSRFTADFKTMLLHLAYYKESKDFLPTLFSLQEFTN